MEESLKSPQYRAAVNYFYMDQLRKRDNVLSRSPELGNPNSLCAMERNCISQILNILTLGNQSAIKGPMITDDGLIIDQATKDKYETLRSTLVEIQKQTGVVIQKHPTVAEETKQEANVSAKDDVRVGTSVEVGARAGASDSVNPVIVSDPALEQMAREDRKFTIRRRERAMNDAQRGRVRSAHVAGFCILGAAATIYFGGQDTHQILQQELDAIYSWDSLVQYIKSLGPLTTLLAAAAGRFIAKYAKFSRQFRAAKQEFEDFNASLENTNTEELGGNDNAKSR